MKIRVEYWRGNTKYVGHAKTYKGAMRIASRNQNAYPPRFYDKDGKELYDTGYGLAYQPDNDKEVYCVGGCISIRH